MADFMLPSWLNDQDAETIQQRMMKALPADIDNTEGGFPYDFTMPTALEKAELLEFFLPETLKIMFPQWAYGEWLDLHAKGVGLTRKPANQASGYLTVTGIAGTVIPAGFTFAVPAIDDSPAIEYQTQEEAAIGEDGEVSIYVVAVEAGTGGNAPAGSIAIMAKPMTGITGITNPQAMTGGTAEEDDDGLRARIAEIDHAAGSSFVGCDADYIRWAKEVPGVGTVLIDTQYEVDHPNWVRLVILDSNGEPANEQIRSAVYDHIMGPEERSIKRLAPIGAILFVEAPNGTTIYYYISGLKLEPEADEDTVLEAFRENLRTYYVTAKEEGVVRHTRVCAVLSRTAGVVDFDGLTMNGDAENINILTDGYPVTGEVKTGE